MSAEALRQALLDEVWAGAASGLGAMLLDEEKIRRAGPGGAGADGPAMRSKIIDGRKHRMQTASELKKLLERIDRERVSGL